MPDEYVITYAVIVNIISLFMMMNDKQKAKAGKWRIRENYFFIASILGGSAGILIGMKIFRHKTKHRSFRIVIPVIFFVQLMAIGYHYLF